MNLWKDLSFGEKAPDVVNMIVECPKGSKNKYEIDKETGLIKLDRAMKTSQDYPFDYGFVPQKMCIRDRPVAFEWVGPGSSLSGGDSWESVCRH